MTATAKKPTFAWGFEKPNGAFFTEFFGSQKAAKEYAADYSDLTEFKLVKVTVSKYKAKK